MTPEEKSQAVKEFKEIYKEEFNEDLDNTEATLKADGLLQLFTCLKEMELIQ